MKNLALHWKIFIGIIMGIIFGIVATQFNLQSFVKNWISPLGDIFINLLKLIAIPLILASLIKGIADLKDIAKIKQMGLITVSIYIITTVIAITIGLTVVNIVNPGGAVSSETVQEITANYTDVALGKFQIAESHKDDGPLQWLVDIVPNNIFGAASNNGNMLQVIFFALFFGISLLLINPKKAKPVVKFIDGINEVILKMVDIIMLVSPYAVFALIATLMVSTTNLDIIYALLGYGICVVVGLALMVVIYIMIVKFLVGKSPSFFVNGILPAQLLAFSTSSSAATLPVTMERVEEHLGVDQEVTSFVCPIGATINMDGTSLYQAVAAVFIFQVLQNDLTLAGQLTIILTATLASIGSAAVPSAGLVMLIPVLQAAGLHEELLPIGIALIFAIDRPLDMCRTMINVTGDATVSMLVAKKLGKLHNPSERKLDDFYKK
ncbi:MAG TPA: dicarboxylate/amino acid:cation symporter [Saprospiraceae bacterium]|nr:dicarboxylate/amino acid:cation symporter [Saprospiraceae bacterium]HRX29993.1 dicarboxylate/amino acid:cation symporter [Saprospiraceae bacterium]